ncbi:MAG: putative porin [Oceanospirillaceae bacterium]|nr:putative porin [Oceanospirillaceae bacterium]
MRVIALIVLLISCSFGNAESRYIFDVELLNDQLRDLPMGKQLSGSTLSIDYGVEWHLDEDGGSLLTIGVRSAISSESRGNEAVFREKESTSGSELSLFSFQKRFGDYHHFSVGRNAFAGHLPSFVIDEDLPLDFISYRYESSYSDEGMSFYLGNHAVSDPYNSDIRFSSLGLEFMFLGYSSESHLRFFALEYENLDRIDRVQNQNQVIAENDEYLAYGVEYGYMKLMDGSIVDFYAAMLKNQSVSDNNRAFRIELSILPMEWEQKFGVAYQRIERDAVVGALNDDNWWFASNVKGFSVFYNMEIAEDFSFSAQYLDENLIGTDVNTQRLQTRLNYSF